MAYSYNGVSGELVAVSDRYCDSMGAYQVATIRTADGDVTVSNKYDSQHSFPAVPAVADSWANARRVASHLARKSNVFSGMGSRDGRLLALVAMARAERLMAKYG